MRRDELCRIEHGPQAQAYAIEHFSSLDPSFFKTEESVEIVFHRRPLVILVVGWGGS